MRTTALNATEKGEIEALMRKLGLFPPMSGQILFNFANGKVASAELARVIWR